MISLFFLSLTKPPLPYQVKTASAECISLSKILGRTITVSQDLSAEVLYVDSRQASGRTELDAVATALHASIVADGKILRIERTPSDLEKLRTARAKEREGWILRWMKKVEQY